ncbi:MAG: hypothetical protein R3Y50_05830 [Rikenellaceae bacterium]
MKKTLLTKSLLLTLSCVIITGCNSTQKEAIKSIDTHETIMKIRTAKNGDKHYAVGSSYDGDIIGVDYDGSILWQTVLDHGIMNHDMACYDLDGDGVDEILAANGNGSLYCLNHKGEIIWQFKESDAPMYSVTGFQKDGKGYVACSGYDLNLYYIDANGEKVAAIPSSSYSINDVVKMNDGNVRPDDNKHSINFIRKFTDKSGEDILVAHGINHTMNISGSRGVLYQFKALEKKPFKADNVENQGPFGSFSVNPYSNKNEILMGSSNLARRNIISFTPADSKERLIDINSYKTDKIIQFGYRVVQTEAVDSKNGYSYFTKYGNNIVLNDSDFNIDNGEILKCRFSFNDMCYDSDNNFIIFASAQSGGSCVHIINLNNPKWKAQYENLVPKGKITKILNNSEKAKLELESFKAPEYEREPLPVYLLSEKREGVEELVDSLNRHYTSPVFLSSLGTDSGFGTDGKAEVWDREKELTSERYINKRDQRRKYVMSHDEIVAAHSIGYEGEPGAAFWGGHGNDPYMFHPSSHKETIANSQGKKTVLIYPELEEHSDEFGYVLDNLIYPLAQYCIGKNANIFVRTKATFWQSIVYLPMWSRLVSGEFAEVFIPAMEETTDKSMELSLASRLGMWASGATNSWGSRCARDNASFDRLRQFSHQNLPNNFLRMQIYHTSLGTQYFDNYMVDQQYMSLLWTMLAKGVIYVPKRSEIVSFSPVHVSMLEPDHEWIDKSNNVKWTTFYDKKFEDEHKYAFSRLNGTWPGAKVTEWDFSRYAAGVVDRRLNFLPSYENGIVMITPPQKGVAADLDAPRGKLTDHIHPIYKDIMSEYYTDGFYYYSADGKEKYPAETYYKTIEKEIKERAKLLPITVKGKVAWVAAQSAPKHLRLTIVDGGYINPDDREVEISFNTIKPAKVVNILTGEELKIDNSKSYITVPCGLCSFLDITLSQEL